jgi:hypothetical protein
MEKFVCVHLKHTNGKEMIFENIPFEMSVVDFKKIVSRKMNYDISTIKFIYKGKFLPNEKKFGNLECLEKVNMIVMGKFKIKKLKL